MRLTGDLVGGSELSMQICCQDITKVTFVPKMKMKRGTTITPVLHQYVIYVDRRESN